MSQSKPKMVWYHEEIPMSIVTRTEAKLQKLIDSQEQMLAQECKAPVVFFELTLKKNQEKVTVVRAKEQSPEGTMITEQILDKGGRVLWGTQFLEGSIYDNLTGMAVYLIRRNKRTLNGEGE